MKFSISKIATLSLGFISLLLVMHPASVHCAAARKHDEDMAGAKTPMMEEGTFELSISSSTLIPTQQNQHEGNFLAGGEHPPSSLERLAGLAGEEREASEEVRTLGTLDPNTPVLCNEEDINGVYRYTINNGTPLLRWYPGPLIADSWDPDWETTVFAIDCGDVKFGEPMNFNLDKLLADSSVRCSAERGAVYRYTYTLGGMPILRLFPDPTVAWSWDPNWLTDTPVIDCKGIEKGDEMQFNHRGTDRIIVHLERIGDETFKLGTWAGTRGEHRRLEGFEIKTLEEYGFSLEYMAHIQDQGDSPWQLGGFVGTRGQSKRLEGFAIRVPYPYSKYWSVQYAANLQGNSDTGFYKDGEFCGTRGQSGRVEAIYVTLVQRG